MYNKKHFMLLVLLLLACLMLSACSSNDTNSSEPAPKPTTPSAPEFTLRNNIKFGDTLETVKGKETFEIKSESATELRTKSGTAADTRIDSIVYRFDESGKLISVLWEVMDSVNTILPPGTFDSLKTSLVAKYGTPDNTDPQVSFLIKGAAIEEMLTDDIGMLAMLIGKGGPIKQCEWQIESKGNQNVKIDLLYYQVYEDDYRVRLSYDLYTDEELDALLQENGQDELRKQNDL